MSGRPVFDGRTKAAYAVAGVLLLIPFVALLSVSSYAKDKPRFADFPFFYWYQFLWVFISAVLTAVAYVLVQSTRRPRGSTRTPDGSRRETVAEGHPERGDR